MGLQSIKWIMTLLVLMLVALTSCNRQVAAPTLTLETVTPVEKPTQPLETPQPTISSSITPTIHQAAATAAPAITKKEWMMWIFLARHTARCVSEHDPLV